MGFKKKFGKLFGFSSKNDEENIQQASQETPEETAEADVTEDAFEDVISDVTEGTVNDSLEEAVLETAEDAEEEMSAETDEEPVEEAEDISEEVFEEVTEDVTEDVTEEVTAETTEEAVEEITDEAPKKGFFAKLKDGLSKTRDSINSKIDNVLKSFQKVDEELFEELEEALIMADVGVDTSLYIIEELRNKVKSEKITEPEAVKGAIEEIISELLCKNDNTLSITTTPSVIMVIGVNGVGKTTSIGKLAARLKESGKNVILGAADTFRAAAIDQLQIWADRSGVEIIKHQEGSDPASVVFDTIAAAKSRGSDCIILDTAGRLHNKKNLMDELGKISRVIERELPDSSVETLLVLDATTGQNAVNQAKLFAESARISGIILTKLDGSAKGGIVLAIAHEQNIPVKLVGVGEGIDDLQNFSSEDFAKALFAE